MKLINLLKEIIIEPEEESVDRLALAQARDKIRDYITNGSKGDLDLRASAVYSLGNLQRVEGHLDLRGTAIQSLGNLEYVGGNLYLHNTPIESLGDLKYVVGSLYLQDTPIQSLGNLEYVGGNLGLRGSKLLNRYTVDQIRQVVDIAGDVAIGWS